MMYYLRVVRDKRGKKLSHDLEFCAICLPSRLFVWSLSTSWRCWKFISVADDIYALRSKTGRTVVEGNVESIAHVMRQFGTVWVIQTVSWWWDLATVEGLVSPHSWGSPVAQSLELRGTTLMRPGHWYHLGEVLWPSLQSSKGMQPGHWCHLGEVLWPIL